MDRRQIREMRQRLGLLDVENAEKKLRERPFDNNNNNSNKKSK